MFSPMPTPPCPSQRGDRPELAAGCRLWAGERLQDEVHPKCLHPPPGWEAGREHCRGCCVTKPRVPQFPLPAAGRAPSLWSLWQCRMQMVAFCAGWDCKDLRRLCHGVSRSGGSKEGLASNHHLCRCLAQWHGSVLAWRMGTSGVGGCPSFSLPQEGSWCGFFGG